MIYPTADTGEKIAAITVRETSPTPQEVLDYDYNQDGAVTIVDAMFAAQIYAGMRQMPTVNPYKLPIEGGSTITTKIVSVATNYGLYIVIGLILLFIILKMRK